MDLRAAAIFDDARDVQDHWDCTNGMAGINTHPTERLLRRWNIRLPRRMFDGMRESVDPTIAAAATVLVLLCKPLIEMGLRKLTGNTGGMFLP